MLFCALGLESYAQNGMFFYKYRMGVKYEYKNLNELSGINL